MCGILEEAEPEVKNEHNKPFHGFNSCNDVQGIVGCMEDKQTAITILYIA